MRLDPLYLAVFFVLLVLAFGGWAVWRQAASERKRWTRYNRPRSAGPVSWVCPTCLTRHHGERAVREQRCRLCEADADG